jgi:hypothetical protein
MRKTLAVAALAAGLTATPALAQNAAAGGLYVGALGGYQGIDVESADGSVSADADSAVYGVNAGYDLSLGSAFVGVEGEFSTSSGRAGDHGFELFHRQVGDLGQRSRSAHVGAGAPRKPGRRDHD